MSPGIYARAFVEGRLTEQQLLNYRQESDGKGIPSYPHPWLMPDFWQFPTVSMGLGPLMAIYQARFLKYLEGRGLATTDNRKVWAFLGDGECDEPESLGAISMAGREKLDNLIFVINCNLQRLDGPVRGNGKIIQELEGVFRGAGWNVIKVVWGSTWDKLFAKDKAGILLKRHGRVRRRPVPGLQEQERRVRARAFLQLARVEGAGRGPLRRRSVEALPRRPRSVQGVTPRTRPRSKHQDQPTVILAKTVKGYGMGESGEGQMISHQAKKMTQDCAEAVPRPLRHSRCPTTRSPTMPFITLAARQSRDDVPAGRVAPRSAGCLPQRRRKSASLPRAAACEFRAAAAKQRASARSRRRWPSCRCWATLVRDKAIGKYIVPIVPDESRTFGMEGMFRQLGIYSSVGQLYKPQDADQLMYYREDKAGQVLQEGHQRGGCDELVDRRGDVVQHEQRADDPVLHLLLDVRPAARRRSRVARRRHARRGFLLGGTAGRTTLNGEGLQHEDGHSHVLASTIPNCISYDPTFAYEVVVIVRDGLRRMYQEQEDVYFYITLMNENYPHPAMPEGAEEGIVKGVYLLQERPQGQSGRACS